MGLLEQVNHKLTLICAALNIALAESSGSVQSFGEAAAKLPPVETVVIPGMTTAAVTAAVLGADTTTVKLITVKEALAAGQKLTGQEIDEQGCYWDKNINTSVPAVTQKNIWKRGKSIDDALYDNRIAHIKSDVVVKLRNAAPAAVTLNVTPETVGSVLPLPGAGATLPLPGAAAGLPIPGASVHQSSLEDPIRKEILSAVNLLTNRYEVDISVVNQLFAEHGAKDGTFVQLPDASYPVVNEKLIDLQLTHDLIEDADEVVRSLNQNDPTYLMTLMTQLKLGTQDLGTVQYRDLYRLYQNVHAYQNQLEAHWQKPLTALKPDPFAA